MQHILLLREVDNDIAQECQAATLFEWRYYDLDLFIIYDFQIEFASLNHVKSITFVDNVPVWHSDCYYHSTLDVRYFHEKRCVTVK